MSENVTNSMDIHEILDHLPHRYPFVLIDRVLSMEVGKEITAIKNVTVNEPFSLDIFLIICDAWGIDCRSHGTSRSRFVI